MSIAARQFDILRVAARVKQVFLSNFFSLDRAYIIFLMVEIF